jgi:2-hydroxychromene-2-carboxylate isomerase
VPGVDDHIERALASLAPTFAIGAEIFWGDDRLEEALAFAAGR